MSLGEGLHYCLTGELPYDHEDRMSIGEQLREQAKIESKDRSLDYDLVTDQSTLDLERDGFSVVDKAFEIRARVNQGKPELTEADLDWVRSLNPKVYPKLRAALLPSQIETMDQAAFEAMDCGYVM